MIEDVMIVLQTTLFGRDGVPTVIRTRWTNRMCVRGLFFWWVTLQSRYVLRRLSGVIL